MTIGSSRSVTLIPNIHLGKILLLPPKCEIIMLPFNHSVFQYCDTGKKPWTNLQNSYKNWNKEVKSDNFCYRITSHFDGSNNLFVDCTIATSFLFLTAKWVTFSYNGFNKSNLSMIQVHFYLYSSISSDLMIERAEIVQ